MSRRRTLPPGATRITLPSGAERIELVLDVGPDPATGKRRQVRRRFRSVDDAIEAYAETKTKVQAGTYVQRHTTTVAEIIESWLSGRHAIRSTTLTGYRNALKPIIAAYGEMKIQNFSKQHLVEIIPLLMAGAIQRKDGRNCRPWRARTVNLMLFVLGQVLDDAMKQGLIVRNVAQLVDRLPQTKTEMQTFTPTEARKVLKVARGHRLELAWRLALYGLRRGEIAGLRWSDIDVQAMTLKVREGRVSVQGQVKTSGPKTAKGKRTLPLTPELVEVIERTIASQAAEQRQAGPAYRASGYVMVNEIGAALHPETLSDKWDELIKVAKVKRIRLHDARHTCATLMHLEGVGIATIAAWLGHADPAFTMRTYVHSQDEALLNAARALGSVTSV